MKAIINRIFPLIIAHLHFLRQVDEWKFYKDCKVIRPHPTAPQEAYCKK